MDYGVSPLIRKSPHCRIIFPSSSSSDFWTRVMLLTVRIVIGRLGDYVVEHVLAESDDACVNVQILHRRMTDKIVQDSVPVWRAKIATLNHAQVRRRACIKSEKEKSNTTTLSGNLVLSVSKILANLKKPLCTLY